MLIIRTLRQCHKPSPRQTIQVRDSPKPHNFRSTKTIVCHSKQFLKQLLLKLLTQKKQDRWLNAYVEEDKFYAGSMRTTLHYKSTPIPIEIVNLHYPLSPQLQHFMKLLTPLKGGRFPLWLKWKSIMNSFQISNFWEQHDFPWGWTKVLQYEQC